MAPRGGRGAKGGGGRGAKGHSQGASKYVIDDADKALGLHDDDFSDRDEEEDDDEHEEVMCADDREEDERGGPKGRRRTKYGEDDTNHKGADDDADPKNLGAATGRQSGAASAGWRGQDFYGGDDAGDDSSADSDEDIVLEEARKMEELRAARLQGREDVLAGLAFAANRETASSPTAALEENNASAAATTTGQFDALFGGEAERGSVTRDLARLSEKEKRALMRKEAPEMLPLLEDFKAKLSVLGELLPLLAPRVLKKLPTSGTAYLKAKAALLLNTLANLSFYLVLRAEGGSVQAHPVVSQLVWLRELQERLEPMDKRLAPRLQKALRAAIKLPEEAEGTAATANKSEEDAAAAESATEPATRRKLSLRERLEQLRKTVPRPSPAVQNQESTLVQRASQRDQPATSDLLRLPGHQRRKKKQCFSKAGTR
jgi:hypothetical protein